MLAERDMIKSAIRSVSIWKFFWEFSENFEAKQSTVLIQME